MKKLLIACLFIALPLFSIWLDEFLLPFYISIHFGAYISLAFLSLLSIFIGMALFRRTNLLPAAWFCLGALLLLACRFILLIYIGNTAGDIRLHEPLFNGSIPPSLATDMIWLLGMAVIYYLFPRLSHRDLNIWIGYVHFAMTFLGLEYLLLMQFSPPGAHSVIPGWHLLIYSSEERRAITMVSIVLLAAQFLLPANILLAFRAGRRPAPPPPHTPST